MRDKTMSSCTHRVVSHDPRGSCTVAVQWCYGSILERVFWPIPHSLQSSVVAHPPGFSWADPRSQPYREGGREGGRKERGEVVKRWRGKGMEEWRVEEEWGMKRWRVEWWTSEGVDKWTSEGVEGWRDGRVQWWSGEQKEERKGEPLTGCMPCCFMVRWMNLESLKRKKSWYSGMPVL